MAEPHFSQVAEALIQSLIYEPADSQVLASYRITSSDPLKTWGDRPRNICCDDTKLGPEVLYRVGPPAPLLKRTRPPKDLLQKLNPHELANDLQVLEVLPTAIPVDVWAFCQQHPKRVFDFRLTLTSRMRGWVEARVFQPAAENPFAPVPALSRRVLPSDTLLLEMLLTNDAEYVDPSLMSQALPYTRQHLLQ